MRVVLALLASVAATISIAAEPNTWTPKLEFQLEESDYTQALVWISGYAYALTEVGHQNNRDRRTRGICVLGDRSVESRVLVDALNEKFKGRRITPEEASPVLLHAVEATYKCSGSK